MTIIDKIKSQTNFTYTERAVVNYMLINNLEIVDLTIHQLAILTNTSNATIIRICKKLGFKGFRDFKLTLITELAALKYMTNSVDFSLPFFYNEDISDIIHNLSSLFKDTIDLINMTIDVDIIKKVIECIANSNQLVIFSVGDSKITAMSFANKVLKINIRPIMATDNHEELVVANNMNATDCALFLSYSGKDQLYNKCIKVIERKGSKIITITARPKSFLVDRSDYVIYMPDKEYDNNIARFYSQLGFEYLLSIIYSGLYSKNYHKNQSHKNALIKKNNVE